MFECTPRIVMTLPKKRRSLSLKEKVEVIQCHDKGGSVRTLAEKFKIGKTQVSDIIRKKAQILQIHRENKTSEKMCRLNKSGPGDVIDKSVLEWFNRARYLNIPVSGPLLQQKAQEVAQQINALNFKASNGWLARFKTRHKIMFRPVCGEASSVDASSVSEWETKIITLIGGYDKQDIFSADETGLFYRALPDKTMIYKGETCSGGNLAKERLTILLCANMKGEKEKPVVISSFLNPGCFKGINLESLGVEWHSNQKAWMTTSIMTEWLEKLNRKMFQQSRKILLFLDYAMSHPPLDLENVKLVFFPPNIKSTLLPMEQGAIQNFKVKYRKLFLQHLLATSEMNSTAPGKGVDVLKAVTWIQKSWAEVAPTTIINCFKKAGFPTCEISDQSVAEDINDLSGLLNILAFGSDVDYDYASIDDKLITDCSSEEIKYVSDFPHPTPASSEDFAEEDDDTSETPHSGTIIRNQTEALEDLFRLLEFYKDNQDEKGFATVNELIMHHEYEMTLSKLKKKIKIEKND